MVSVGTSRDQFQKILDANSDKIRFRKFTIARSATDYDDEVTLSSPVDTWASGNVQQVDSLSNSQDALLVQQGKLLQNDIKVYVLGTIDTSGTWKMGLGSPHREEYAPIPDGIQTHFINGSPIYKKLFLRVLPNGSLIGE